MITVMQIPSITVYFSPCLLPIWQNTVSKKLPFPHFYLDSSEIETRLQSWEDVH